MILLGQESTKMKESVINSVKEEQQSIKKQIEDAQKSIQVQYIWFDD